MAIKISNSTIIDDSRNIIGAGQANFTGIVTASSYSGSGSNLTGIVTNIASGGGVISSVSNGQASLVVNSLGSSVEQLGILTHPSAYSSRTLFGIGGVASDYDASTIIVNDASVDSNRNIYIFDKSASGYDFVGVVTETYGVTQFQGSDSVMSDDGTIFAVSRRESIVSSSNQIVIWQRTGNTFSGIATITEASVGNGTNVEGWGASFDMSSDGTKFVIGSGANQVAGIGSTDYGTAYVIDRSGSTVTGIATLVGTASTQSSTSAFGVVAMSDDGSTILVGDPVGIHTVNGVDYGGIVYKFTRTGNTVTQVGIITGSRFSTTDRFGGGVEISGDGSRIFVADPNSNVVGAASSSGIVYVYDSNLNEIQQISPHPNTTTGGNNTFGLGFLFRSSGLNYSYGKLLQSSYDGKVLVIGDSNISNFYIYIYDISLNQYILNKEVDFSTGSLGTGWNVAVSGDGTRSFIPDINYLPTGGSAKGALYYYQNTSSNLLQFGSNIGIGTANPTSKLQIDGNIDFVGNSIKIGYCAGASDDKSNNYNNFLGYYAGGSNTTGSHNNFFGNGAGACNTTGTDNIFVGRSAGFANTTGTDNVFFGYQSGCSNTNGIGNNFTGGYSGQKNTTGRYNNFFGVKTGWCNISGCDNIFFGRYSGCANVSGSSNTFLGAWSGRNSTGSTNVFIGKFAGCTQTAGSDNVIIGHNVQLPILDGSNQLAIGAGNTAWISGNSSYNVGLGTDVISSSFTTPGQSKLFVAGPIYAATTPWDSGRALSYTPSTGGASATAQEEGLIRYPFTFTSRIYVFWVNTDTNTVDIPLYNWGLTEAVYVQIQYVATNFNQAGASNATNARLIGRLENGFWQNPTTNVWTAGTPSTTSLLNSGTWPTSPSISVQSSEPVIRLTRYNSTAGHYTYYHILLTIVLGGSQEPFL